MNSNADDIPTSPADLSSADIASHTMTPTEDDTPHESSPTSNAPSGDLFPPTVPAHIAARFYRPNTSSASRRKSSAASSRRTSISSSHSHPHFSPRGCQSDHVAQHLRRASILESRKARLADRAAHAEQVRLRAALAKASLPPRASTSEERALAAQLAREKHLAQVAAACAEEVRRAKKVAEEAKLRKAAEEQRCRLEMEEKHAEAEKRRLEFLRNLRRPRTGSQPGKRSSPSPKRSLDRETAILRIQRAWRMWQRKNVVFNFLELGFTIDDVRDTSFEEISGMLAEERVLTRTSKLLGLFGLLSEDENANTRGTATRTFLSAFLILGHPTAVLSGDGDQEQDLINKAKDFIICFENALSKVSSSKSCSLDPSLLDSVYPAHATFVSAFTDWKARDASTLIETMVASFVNLDAIWQSVKDDTRGEVAEDYRQGIRDNQVLLLSKIRKLAGPDRANMLIKKAIRESRRARPKRRPIGEVKPRGAENGPDSSSEIAAQTTGDVSAASDIASSHNVTHSDEDSQSHSLTKLFSVVPPNRIVVHELAIDKDYRIDAGPQSDVRNTVNRTICDNMREGFENGKGDIWTVAMAENIREKLLRLLKPGNSLHTAISEALDPDHVNTQCRQGVFSYSTFFKFMATLIPKLCAPYRDAHVKKLCEDLQASADAISDGVNDLSGMIDTLFSLLHTIDLISLDHSNFLLMLAAPQLIPEAPAYEHREFAADLESKRITLNKTRSWWRDAALNVLTEADRRDPLYGARPSHQQIYARGLVDLALGPAAGPLRSEDVPETLSLDVDRLANAREVGVRIATVSAILLTAKNLLKRDVRSAWKVEANRLWDLLPKCRDVQSESSPPDSEDLPTRLLSTIESSHALPPATRTTLLNTITRLLSHYSALRVQDPVSSVLHRRLKAHVLGRVAASTSGERVRAASTATQGLLSAGLPEFTVQVQDMVTMLRRVLEVDGLAHGEWYEQIADEVDREGGDRSPAAAE